MYYFEHPKDLFNLTYVCIYLDGFPKWKTCQIENKKNMYKLINICPPLSERWHKKNVKNTQKKNNFYQIEVPIFTTISLVLQDSNSRLKK